MGCVPSFVHKDNPGSQVCSRGELLKRFLLRVLLERRVRRE